MSDNPETKPTVTPDPTIPDLRVWTDWLQKEDPDVEDKDNATDE